jgi:hypothetical protein
MKKSYIIALHILFAILLIAGCSDAMQSVLSEPANSAITIIDELDIVQPEELVPAENDIVADNDIIMEMTQEEGLEDNNIVIDEQDEERTDPLSPRNYVKGILAEPELSWSAISMIDEKGITHSLSFEDAQQIHQILSTIDAVEVLTPFHYEGQFSDPMFIILIEYDDYGAGETIYAAETGFGFFRFTETTGDQGDRGYVAGTSENKDLYDILSSYVQE